MCKPKHAWQYDFINLTHYKDNIHKYATEHPLHKHSKTYTTQRTHIRTKNIALLKTKDLQ